MKKIYWIILYLVSVSILFANPAKLIEFKSIGFSIEKPNTWEEVTSEEFLDSKNRVYLDSKTLTKLLHESREVPLFSIRKGDPEIEKYLTTINIKAQKSDLEFNNIPADLRTYLFRLSLVLKNFDYIVEPKTVRINGNLAGYALFSHSLLDEENNETKVVSAFWIFPMKDHIYLVGSGFLYEDFESFLDEIKKIVGTIKFSKR